jgi:hypothetical protein
MTSNILARRTGAVLLVSVGVLIVLFYVLALRIYAGP